MRFAVVGLAVLLLIAIGIGGTLGVQRLTEATDHSACAEYTRSLDQYSIGGIYWRGGPNNGKLLSETDLAWDKAAFDVRNAACKK